MSKKILLFGGDGNSLIKFRLHFMKSLIEDGHQIFASAPNISEDNLHILNSNNIQFYSSEFDRKSFSFIGFIRNLLGFISVTKKVRPDIIFSYNHKPVILGSFAGSFCGVKSIYSLITGSGHLFENENVVKKIRRKIGIFLFWIAARLNTRFIFQNPDDLLLFNDLGIIKKEKCYQVNGSGIDIAEFSFREIGGDIIFLCMARLIKSKGLIEFANACRLVKKQVNNVQFYLAGPSDKHEDSISVKEIKSKWKSVYGVEYLGNIDDVKEILSKCSCYVLLSYNEGTPRSVLEAMSIGRPIITTDTSGCRETVKDGYNGYKVPVKNYQEAAKRMIELCNLQKAKQLGRNSRIYCEEKYDVKKVVASLKNGITCLRE